MAEDQPSAALVEVDHDEYDSAVGGDSIRDSTTSIASSVLKYREENGRTYHAYKEGSYMFPNDETEKDRLDLNHHIWQMTFDGKLYTANIPKGKVLHRVLDVGTGTGIWAIDFADAHPESTVLGVDLSPIQPAWIPPNLRFEVDDISEPWTYKEKFDFIYSRMMIGSLADVPRFFDQALANLNPGGILEMADCAYPIEIREGVWPEDSALLKWANLVTEALGKIGRRSDAAALYKDQMIAAGFVNVVETKYMWPLNRWPKDKHLKDLGLWNSENMKSGLEGWCVALFTNILGWTKEEVDVFLIKVQAEIANTKIHSYWTVIVVTGEKPE